MCDDDTQNIEDKFIEQDPKFMVESTRQPGGVRHNLREQQHETTQYFIKVEGNEIVTKPTVLWTPRARQLLMFV